MKTKLLLLLLLANFSIYAQTNLVPNGNFETWTSSSQPDNWYRYFSGFVSQSPSAQNGKSSTNMMIASGTFNYINSEYFAVQANKTYRITLYHKTVKGTFTSVDLSLYHKPSAIKEEIFKKSDITFSTTEWRKIEFEYTSKVAENIEVDIWTTGSLDSEILIDNVSVVDIADIPVQYTLIPDADFEKELITLNIDSGLIDGKVETSKISKLTTLYVNNRSIKDLTGIEDFTALKTLDCSNNALSSLNISKNTALTGLYASSNQITNLDLSQNKALTSIVVNYNKLVNLDVSNNINLLDLFYYGNAVTSIDLSQNLALVQLDCSKNGLTSIDISKNINLTSFDCTYNSLTDINLSKNTALTDLRCYENQFKSLDFTNNKRLIRLDCQNNPLETLNISNLDKLTNLECRNTSLTTLNVSTNAKLEILGCSRTKLKNLDLSKNTALTSLVAEYNYLLETVNLQNGQNSTIKSIYLTKSPNLYCILVDDVAYANTKWSSGKDLSVNFSLTCTAPEYTLIPDAEFEKGLISNGLDAVIDGKVLTAAIANAEYLQINSEKITDLKGLEAFKALKTFIFWGSPKGKITKLDVSALTHLTKLDCSNNSITEIDLSNNLELKELSVGSNSLTNLNVSKNIALESLAFYGNNISEIDLTNNKALKFLYCSENTLTALDVTGNPVLNTLNFESNKVTTIDLSKNTELESFTSTLNPLKSLNVSNNKKLLSLKCGGGSFTSNSGGTGFIASLDLSNNTLMTILECPANQISQLDLTANTKLQRIICYGNMLSSLDISKNTALTDLKCSYNALKTLNLKNGNNTKINNIELGTNDYLSCIQVDDVDYSNSKWTKKDAQASFSSDCAYTTLIPDTKFEEKLIALGIDTDGKNGKVLTANIASLTSLDVSKADITDLSGIDGFSSLESLTADENNLTKIDLTKNFKLVNLNIAKNQLTRVNLNSNSKLQTLYCNDNLLTYLDLSKNKNLIGIYCPNNKLTSLNLKNGNNTAFEGPGIKNFTDNPDLSCIQVDDVTYSNQKWTAYKDATASYSSNCEYTTAIPDPKFEDKLIALGIDSGVKDGKVATASINEITTLNVDNSEISDLTGIQDFIALKTLSARTNLIKNVDFSKNIILTSLDVTSNSLTTIDVSNNLLLKKLSCGSNYISSLNVTKNTALTSLTFDMTRVEAIDISQNKDLSHLSCSNGYLKNLDISKNPKMYYLNCFGNELQTLNLQNGNNTSMYSYNVTFSGNQNLYCILVDDVAFANANWSERKNTFTTFNTECTGEINLPANNFTVETKAESCLGENNGEINITARNSFAYAATINNKAYSFTNNYLKVAALTPGIYKIKITIPSMIFEQNFTVTIAKGASITGKSSITAKTVDVEITEGTAPFTVFVNGTEQFQTTASNFSLDINKGGLIEVATAKACEGIFSKKIATSDLLGTLAAYPNPTSGSFEIEIPSDKNEVKIELYNFAGQLISHKTYTIENGKAKLNLENQPSGIYAAKIYLETPEYIKIIKK